EKRGGGRAEAFDHRPGAPYVRTIRPTRRLSRRGSEACFASWHARSASPTMANPGKPFSRCASTSTRRVSRPTSACVMVRASTRSTLGAAGSRVCDRVVPKLKTARPLAGDDHVLEELAGPATGPPVDVPPVARLDLQACPFEDLRVELAAVVDHDHDPRPTPQRPARIREDGRDPVDVLADHLRA